MLPAAKVDCGERANLSVSSELHEHFCKLTQSIVLALLASSYLNWAWKKKQYPLPLASVACAPADAAALERDSFQMQWKVLHKVPARGDSSWLGFILCMCVASKANPAVTPPQPPVEGSPPPSSTHYLLLVVLLVAALSDMNHLREVQWFRCINAQDTEEHVPGEEDLFGLDPTWIYLLFRDCAW